MHTLLVSLIIFLSACVLFIEELVIGKSMLPLYGGSAEVWAQSLFFFTLVIFIAYWYAYLLARWGHRHALILHIWIVSSALTWSLYVLLVGVTLPTGIPLLLRLFVLYGPLIFVLGTTSPVMQFWVRESGSYRGYSLSNIGSLMGLGLFPFVLEPLVSLTVLQWCVAMVLMYYGLALALILSKQQGQSESAPKISQWPQMHRWLVSVLTALPAYVLVSTTTAITHFISPLPLVWIFPLGLYLCGISYAFLGRGTSVWSALAVVVTALLTLWVTPAPWELTFIAVLCALLLVFFVSVRAHAYAYALRPPHRELPLFYVYFALGGALGTFGASMVSPYIFNNYWEIVLGLVLSLAMGMYGLLSHRRPHMQGLFVVPAVLCAASAVMWWFVVNNRLSVVPVDATLLYQSRTMYGVVAVADSADTRLLLHGRTLHGMQIQTPSSQALAHVLYYGTHSGIGKAFAFLDRTQQKGISVGIVGLGAGGLSAFCRPQDSFTYYEIDPSIESVARTYFTYLEYCKNTETRVGDGRLLLEKRKDDIHHTLIVIDAFSDDVIPHHLLTREALASYHAVLAQDGIIAFHVSNRYVNLVPVLSRLAMDARDTFTIVADPGRQTDSTVGSVWVLMSRDPDVFSSREFADIHLSLSVPAGRVWTDDHASILPFVVFPRDFNFFRKIVPRL